MKLYKVVQGAIVEENGSYYQLDQVLWDNLVNRDDLYNHLKQAIQGITPEKSEGDLLKNIESPIGSQEIWASGVTYYKSREARMEESEDGGDFYDKVYDAERPELFFKGNAFRTAHPGGELFIRKDSKWDVPEPELTLFMTSNAKIVAYTIGNDMSSRSIEGENPLYLPQAKVYDKCAGLGPCLYVTEKPIPENTSITLEIFRNNEKAFSETIGIDQMKRKHTDLVEFLFRECSFPTGCFLMTGTGIVPPNEFTLQEGDKVSISIEHIGTLTHSIAKK
ncbi:fumarylacetoacetate hydrolase family protein [Flexithrix dorotheae]|uniref:fumarylacetoacetate hydrolase family protein n=1 Tax=Flexithrix dorotheae TaxID=70993 RepID=UPI00036C79FB|nr:fumarylacetoacetate hydrolase family protein [Flexithrix dorotheae]